MNQLNRISLGISATIFTIIGIVLFINPIEHIGSFSWLISCGFFLISLSRFSRYYRLRQAGIIHRLLVRRPASPRRFGPTSAQGLGYSRA